MDFAPDKFALRSTTLALLAGFVVAVSHSTSFAADEPAEVDVSADGGLRIERSTAEESRLLFASGTVPLPSIPDWESDQVRAIGGMKFADMDGDSDLDLVLGCYFQNGFPSVDEYENLIHYNLGTTLETTPSWISTVERHTADCQVGDVNGDGIPDMYFANGTGTTVPSTIYYGKAGGPNTTPDWLSVDATWAIGGAFGDIDGDGLLDLVQVSQGPNQFDPKRPVQVFFNQGSALETIASYESADSAITNTAAIADLDESSQVTVTSHQIFGDNVTTIFYLPNAPIDFLDRVDFLHTFPIPYTFDRTTGRIQFESPPQPGLPVEVDYRYSTLPDVAVSRWVNYDTGVYSNTGSGLSATPTWTRGVPAETDRGLAFADVDSDDDLDLALGNSGEPTFLYRNDSGALAAIVWEADSSAFYGTQEVAWGDVDADGDEDLATIEFGNGHLRVYLNNAGVLDPVPAWFYDFSSSGSSLAWGDVNGDGYLDLAAGTARGPATVFLNTSAPDPTGAPVSTGYTPDLAAWPNPFRGHTTIQASSANPGVEADIEIFDTRGRRVRTLDASNATWDGRDAQGQRVAAGIYFLRQEAGEALHTGTVTLLR